MKFSFLSFLFISLLILPNISCENPKRVKPKVNLILHITYIYFQPKITVTCNNKKISVADFKDFHSIDFEHISLNYIYPVDTSELISISVENEFNDIQHFTVKLNQSDTIHIDPFPYKDTTVDYFMLNNSNDSLSLLAEFTFYDSLTDNESSDVFHINLFRDSCTLNSVLRQINYFDTITHKTVQQLNPSYSDSINQLISGCTNRFSSRIYCVPHTHVYLTLKKGNYIYRCDKMTPDNGLKYEQLFRIVRRLCGVKVRG